MSIDGQLVVGMEFRRGPAVFADPAARRRSAATRNRDGVTRETSFEHTLDGVRTRFGGARIWLGDHPYSKELASLGFRSGAMMSSSG